MSYYPILPDDVGDASYRWTRPTTWPNRPEGFESKAGIYYLVEHTSMDEQTIFFACTKAASVYVNGEFKYVTIPSESSVVKNYIDLSEQVDSFEFNGMKFTWVYIAFDGSYGLASIFQGDDDVSKNPYRSLYNNVKELIINCDLNLLSQTDGGLVHAVPLNVKSIYFKPECFIGTANNLYRNTRLLNVENPPKLRGSALQTFRDSDMSCFHTKLDMTYVNNTSGMFYGNGFGFFSVDMTNSENIYDISYIAYYSPAITSFTMDNASGVNSAEACFYNAIRLQNLILNGMAASFDIRNTYKFSKQGILLLIDSLKDLTALESKSILLNGNPNAADAEIASAAFDKNWTIVI